MPALSYFLLLGCVLPMEEKLWKNLGLEAEGEGEEEEEDSEDETDEEEEKERYVGKENADKWVGGRVAGGDGVESEDGNGEDGEVDAEPLGRASKANPPAEDRRVKGQREKLTDTEESGSGSGSGSEGSSDEETGRSIALILASDGSRREKPSRAGVGQTEDTVVKNSKSEIQNMAREEVKEQEKTPTRRKKEGGTRKRELKSPSTKGKEAHSQSEKETLQAQKPDREGINEEQTETARKKSRKQKHFVQADSQKQDSQATEEPKIKYGGPQKMEKVTEKKANKKHRVPENDKVPLERIELESESKVKNQKQQKSQLSADNDLKFQQSQQPLSLKKQKKPTVWSPDDEIALAYSVKHHLKLVGKNVPKRAEDMWDKVSEKLHNNRTKEQIYDKVRRMRCRYLLIAREPKVAGSIPFNYKNKHEENLFRIWNQIWGKEEGENDEDNGEEEAGEEEHEHSMSIANAEASNPRTEVRGKELLSAREKQGQRRDEDANDTLQECATPMALDQTHLPTSTLASPANASTSNGPLESSAELMQPQQTTSVLNGTGDRMLPQPDAENPLMTEIFNFMRTSNQVMLEEVKSQCDRVLGEVQAKTKTVVEHRIKSAAKGFQIYNGMNYFMPCPFPVPSLAGGDAMDIKLPDCNKEAHDNLMQQWHAQHLQELKILSQRLSLMQEQCRIQQEELEFGMR